MDKDYVGVLFLSAVRNSSSYFMKADTELYGYWRRMWNSVRTTHRVNNIRELNAGDIDFIQLQRAD